MICVGKHGTFQGVIDGNEYKELYLVMLFVKYISDVWQDHMHRYAEQYKGNQERINRAMAREASFFLSCEFLDLYKERNAENIGEIIDITIANIEEANKEKLEGDFQNITFNTDRLGKLKTEIAF